MFSLSHLRPKLKPQDNKHAVDFYYLQLENLFQVPNIIFRTSKTPMYCRLGTTNDPQTTCLNFIIISGCSITTYSFSHGTNTAIILKNVSMQSCIFLYGLRIAIKCNAQSRYGNSETVYGSIFCMHLKFCKEDVSFSLRYLSLVLRYLDQRPVGLCLEAVAQRCSVKRCSQKFYKIHR